MKAEFHKYEGAGNDFILFDGRGANFKPDEKLLARLCDRRFGIGADGAMILQDDEQYDFLMRYFNSDGREATMCGNGGRCITLFADDLGIGSDLKTFRAVDGLHTGQMLERRQNSGRIRLRMADVESIERFGNGWFLNTGSPHYVEFVDDVEKVDVFHRGQAMRYSPEIASWGGANINFVEIKADGELSVRTYERGVEDETFACGTGATASAIAANHVFQNDIKSFDIKVRGGMLRVEFATDNLHSYSNIHLTGPASKIFCGTIETNNFTDDSI